MISLSSVLDSPQSCLGSVLGRPVLLQLVIFLASKTTSRSSCAEIGIATHEGDELDNWGRPRYIPGLLAA